MLPAIPEFSARVRNLHASPIREILSVIERPGMVSFAGGLPALDAFPDFPTDAIPRRFLQYGPSEGEPELRARIAAELQARGLECSAEQVIVLSGSQQGIDLVAKLFIDEGTPVAVESPTYLAALQVFRFFGARLRPFAPRADTSRPPFGDATLAYAIPNFQNPTGRCYGADERDALARACDAGRVTLFEDDPYRDLNYDGCATDPVCARLERAHWIYQGSFSKSLAPGLRLGYLAASRELVPYLVRLKQAADLHSNRVSQWYVLNALESPLRPERMKMLVERYRRRRDAFATALDRHFSQLATWHVPPGGLFFWLTLNGGAAIDTRRLLGPAIERNVAFMPGEPFFPGDVGHANAIRLNFSHADSASAEHGLATLAALVAETVEPGVACV